jgi:hypothetical protein
MIAGRFRNRTEAVVDTREALSAGLERDCQVNLLSVPQHGHAHGLAHLIVVEPHEQYDHDPDGHAEQPHDEFSCIDMSASIDRGVPAITVPLAAVT